jgi:hypothetical protein
MLNKSPIFINGFQRGGTSIFLDLISSHPNVCSIGRETHQVFYGIYGKGQSRKTHPIIKWGKRFVYIPFWGPVLVTSRQNTFATICLDERQKLPKFISNYVDFLFYWHKLNASVNKYKLEGVEYSEAELKNSRLLCKNLDGVVLATDLFYEIYPNATFINILRNGLAICEGFIYRGFTAEYCGKMYEKICQKMILDSQCRENYHIVKFEDLLSDPLAYIKKVYKYIDLDLSLVNKFRVHTKKSIRQDGLREYRLGSEDYQVFWLTLEDLANFLRPDVNENQIKRLNIKDRDIFLKYASRSMEYFGYI